MSFKILIQGSISKYKICFKFSGKSKIQDMESYDKECRVFQIFIKQNPNIE